jgi:O-succinylbenzoic acid--CoA ligase
VTALPAAASLRPLSGTPREIERLVTAWLAEDDPQPLTVRTSGSTSGPKDVLLSTAAVTASATATNRRIGGPGRWLLALPSYYVAGLQVITRSVLAGTAPVALDDHPDLASATRALNRSTEADASATRRYAALVPTQLHRFLASPADTEALTAYDCILLGGSAAPPQLLATARDRGVPVVTTYGMSETCGGCVYDGVALDGVAVAISADGEIRIAGPTLFDGYAGQVEATAAVLRDGWFHTADLGRLDDNGRLTVLGRRDDVVISGGVNVPLPAVEDRVRAMRGLGQAAVTSRPDPEWGSEVVVVVESATSPVPTLGAVRDFVAAEHPRAWAPRALVVVAAMPMLSSGKVDRQRLAEILAGRAP